LIVDFGLSTLQGRYTAVDDFYIRSRCEVPSVPRAYSLRIDGEVEKPMDVHIDDLRQWCT
jgi:DMSO/TMAO reductase YedYZ molybdopterin-dependent catalytic subunit